MIAEGLIDSTGSQSGVSAVPLPAAVARITNMCLLYFRQFGFGSVYRKISYQITGIRSLYSVVQYTIGEPVDNE